MAEFPVPPAGRDGPERTPVIVEIAGSSGSGKSTLLKEVLRECRERDVPAAAAEDFLMPWLSGVIRRNPTLLNLALDLRSVSEAITLRRHREFLAFAMAVIRRDTDRPATALSAYRGVFRKLSAHAALARKASHGRAVLVDEGTIHSAHYVLVHVNSAPRPRDIAAFCRLVPVPDLVIYVTAPLERVLDRTAGEGARKNVCPQGSAAARTKPGGDGTVHTARPHHVRSADERRNAIGKDAEGTHR